MWVNAGDKRILTLRLLYYFGCSIYFSRLGCSRRTKQFYLYLRYYTRHSRPSILFFFECVAQNRFSFFLIKTDLPKFPIMAFTFTIKKEVLVRVSNLFIYHLKQINKVQTQVYLLLNFVAPQESYYYKNWLHPQMIKKRWCGAYDQISLSLEENLFFICI